MIPHANPPASNPRGRSNAHLRWLTDHAEQRQAGGLGEAEHDVGGLDRLTRCALGEVVLGRDREHGVGARVEAHGDVHDVRAVRRLGARRVVDDHDAGIVRVELAVLLEQAHGRQAAGPWARIASGKDPRVVGTRCGVNNTSTDPRATCDNACSISAVWRCVSRPYALTFSFDSENKLVVFNARPAPETPDTALAMMPRGSISRSAAHGASARLTAVG